MTQKYNLTVKVPHDNTQPEVDKFLEQHTYSKDYEWNVAEPNVIKYTFRRVTTEIVEQYKIEFRRIFEDSHNKHLCTFDIVAIQ